MKKIKTLVAIILIFALCIGFVVMFLPVESHAAVHNLTDKIDVVNTTSVRVGKSENRISKRMAILREDENATEIIADEEIAVIEKSESILEPSEVFIPERPTEDEMFETDGTLTARDDAIVGVYVPYEDVFEIEDKLVERDDAIVGVYVPYDETVEIGESTSVKKDAISGVYVPDDFNLVERDDAIVGVYIPDDSNMVAKDDAIVGVCIPAETFELNEVVSKNPCYGE